MAPSFSSTGNAHRFIMHELRGIDIWRQHGKDIVWLDTTWRPSESGVGGPLFESAVYLK